jgi:hypothetical protein
MRKVLLTLVCLLTCLFHLNAQIIRTETEMVPSGKGHGVPAPQRMESDDAALSYSIATGNGISHHGGPVMPGAVHIYFIWYGNWTNGSRPTDSQSTVTLLSSLFASGGLGGSGYSLINSTYGDKNNNVSGNFSLTRSAVNNYASGKSLSDSAVLSIVSNAISKKTLPKDANAIYFVLTASDVNATSGFCTQYCGWHSHANISGTDIKYGFVGNPDRCPSACEPQSTSPNSNSGADGMASVLAHETEEAISDPDLNAWYDAKGDENADKCAWRFGPTTGSIGSGAYNQTLAGRNWLIQMNWENARGGGCSQTKGGTFYNF